jgi:uncharacterized protein YjbJ (UPF0337 family)
MVNQQVLEGHWNEIKGKLRTRWGQLSENELEQAHGRLEDLVGTIQRKTGATREEIEGYLSEVTAAASGRMGEAADKARQYAQQASDQLYESSHEAAEAMRQSYEQYEQMVRQRPLESVTLCFGVGLVAGVLVGLLLKSR